MFKEAIGCNFLLQSDPTRWNTVRVVPMTGGTQGGLRFDPTVNLSVLKFLGFEQVITNPDSQAQSFSAVNYSGSRTR